MPEKDLNIVLLGYGNLGSHLGPAIVAAGLSLKQIYSRSKTIPPVPSQTQLVHTIESVLPDADLYLLAVSDQSIAPMAGQLRKILTNRDAIVVHHSGATSLEPLKQHFKHHAACWPLQSFSKGESIDFGKVPFCVEYSDAFTRQKLEAILSRLSPLIYPLTGDQRKEVHLAAVLANNFTNVLYAIAERRLLAQDIPFDLLRPLILQTAQKVQKASPKAMQTGPAIRNDQVTMEQHLSLLTDEPETAQLYRLLSRIINPGVKSEI